MKKLTSCIALVVSTYCYSQIDTVRVNESKYVRIDVKEPIELNHISNPNDFFIEIKGNNLFIQPLDSLMQDSNLFIGTKNNNYDFFINYTPELKKYVYSVGESIKERETGVIINEKYEAYNPLDYKKDSFIRSRNLVAENGIILFIKGIFIKNDYMYFLFEISNRTGIPYEVKSIDFFVVQNKELKSKSMTEELVPYEHIYEGLEQEVPARRSKFITMVFKKFTLNERNIIVRLREKNGERNLNFPLKNELIIKTKDLK